MQIKILALLGVVCFFGTQSCNVAFGAPKYDADAVRKYLEQKKSATNIKFVESCDGAAGTCVEDVFESTNVQMLQAIALAQEYGTVKYDKQLICSPEYRQSFNDDYIKCTDSTGTSFFEFRFDDVKESLDNTIKKSVAVALCQIHSGKMSDDNVCVLGGCTALNNSLNKFGYSADFINNMGGARGCKIDFGTVAAADYTLKTAYGVSPEKFKNLQIQSGADLEFLLRRETQRQMKKQGIAMSNFSCAQSFKTYKTGDITNPKDDILTCVANGNQIDFLFDDMQEMLDFAAGVGASGLQCIADSGGTYDGKNCHGLTKEQCAKLNSEIDGGTRWDATLETCVLKNAAKAETVKDVTNIGLSVGLGIATVATGGGVMVIVFAVAASAGAVAKKTAQEIKETDIRAFLATSAKCQSSNCAEKTLLIFIDNIAPHHNDITGQLLSAVDEELARLINLVPDNSNALKNALNQTINNRLKLKDFNNWSNADKLNFAGDVLLTIGASAGVAAAAKTGWANLVKLLKSSVKNTKATMGVIEKTKKIVDAGGTTDDLIDVVTSVSDISEAI